MSKQGVQPAIVGFGVSASIVILALVMGEGAPRGDNAVPEWLTTSDESTASEQEPALPDWLTDYNLHAHIIGVVYSPPDRHPRLVGSFESDALMDSLSPGVRASYEGALRERVEVEHAEYAERRLRWLREDRAARK